MVKIRELSDKQLVSQLEKYEKIYNQLINEREKRASRSGGYEGLLTQKEVSELVSEEEEVVSADADGDTQAFQLKFDQEELNQMQEEEEKSNKPVEEDDEVRVTQLLRLSKEQMEELKQGAKKITKKKMMKKKKKV